MRLDIDHELSSFVGDDQKLNLCSRKNFIVANYVCDRVLFLLSFLSSPQSSSSASSSSPSPPPPFSSSSTTEAGSDAQHSLPMRWYICPVLNGLCKTIGNRLHCRHFRLQARWQSVLVRLQSSVSSSRCCSQNCCTWLLLSETQHPELRYEFISQTAFAMCIRVSNRIFHKRKPVERKIVIKRPK